MPSIDEMLECWKQDNHIDETQLNRELIRTPIIHAKYLEYFMYFKTKLAQAEKKYNKLAYIRKKYYRGELTKQDLDHYGWEQYQGLKMSNSEFNQQMDIDPVLLDLKEIVDGYKSAVSVVEYIMKQIHQRDYSLKSIIDYNKFLNGN